MVNAVQMNLPTTFTIMELTAQRSPSHGKSTIPESWQAKSLK
jgi:hypothetical protein